MKHEFKGTTGLWKAIENEDCFEVCTFEGGIKYIIAEGIEQGFDGGLYDAHLIAAAPDLLEALQKFVHRAEIIGGFSKELPAARAAISKALNQEV